MTFSLALHQENKYVLRALNHSIWYHHNKKRIQAQQRKYREINKEKVRGIWRKSMRKQYKKNKLSLNMYSDLMRLEKASK
jgi:prolyl oligopeptidase PreP (S9A serine peptidase family)